MTTKFADQDRAYYEQLLEQVMENFPWTPIEDTSAVEDALFRAGDESPSVGELQLIHLHTDAYMYLNIPDYREGNAARMTLYHPLDRHLPSKGGEFIDSLGRSHQSITEVYQSDYIRPVADPNVILHCCIPINYSTEKVYSAMTAISAIVLRIQRLHGDIQSPLVELLSRPSTKPDGSLNSGNCCVSMGG